MRFDPLGFCFGRKNRINSGTEDGTTEEFEVRDISEQQVSQPHGNHGNAIPLIHVIAFELFSAESIRHIRSILPLNLRRISRHDVYFAAGSNRQLARQSGRPTNIMPPSNTVNGHGDSAGLTGRREMENIPPTPTTTAASYNVAQVKQKQQQLQSQQQQQQQQQVQIENGRARRSNVVKEVERLKKNREERRQRQAELKEEKEALMNLDPGNPNWEFLAMIRSAVVSSLFLY